MAENVFSTEAIANALENQEQQLRQQRRREDAQRIVTVVRDELDKVARERVYGTSQEVVNANPTQQSTSNGSYEPQQPAAQDPLVALAAREIASADTVDVQGLHRKAEELASINGRDPGRVVNELAELVAAMRGEVDESSAGQQNPSRVPGTGFVKNLFSRDDR